MMDSYGFIRTAAAVPVVKVADTDANVGNICELISEADSREVSLIVFPELSVTGYTCGDLFSQDLLIGSAERGVAKIVEYSRGRSITIVVGVPVRYADRLYNCAVVIRNGNIKGMVPKLHLPGYREFYESRWFSSGRDFLSGRMRNDGPFLDNGKDCFREGFGAVIRYAGQRCNISPNLIFSIGNVNFAVEICEDLWSPIPPSTYHSMAGASLIVNLSASNEILMKNAYRKELVSQQSARTVSGYVYCSSGFGESTQDVVYAGASMIYENGTCLAESRRFEMVSSLIVADIDCNRLSNLRQKMNTFEGVSPDGTTSSVYATHYSRISLGMPSDTDFERHLYRTVDPHPFVPADTDLEASCREILSIQVTGLVQRLRHIGCRTAVLGVSGGLDSTLALLVTVLAADKAGWSRDRVIGVTMPGYGTTDRTRGNAGDLMDALGITSREISIAGACDRHFEDIGHDKSVHDVTYENAQARERTQILMDVANQTGGIVIGTGDLSELALGWATYNGDHMSMYGVNATVAKTLIRPLVRVIAGYPIEGHSGMRGIKDILLDILDTPVSPELLPADGNGRISQVTEDIVGPYELHDFFLYNFCRFGYSPSKILFLARKAFPEEQYSCDVIKKWLRTFIRRFFSQQFKRSCLPDGPKVGAVSLSPRGDWRMPSDAEMSLFLKELDENRHDGSVGRA